MRKYAIAIMLFMVFIPIVLAQAPVGGISRTDQLIRDQHESTRKWCADQWNSKDQGIKAEFEKEKEVLIREAKNMFWWDRILSFGSLFFAVFAAMSLRGLLDLNIKRKQQTLTDQEEVYKGNLPEPPEAPKEGKNAKGYRTSYKTAN